MSLIPRPPQKFAIDDIVSVNPYGGPQHTGKITSIKWHGDPYNEWAYGADWWISTPGLKNAVEGGSFYENTIRLENKFTCPCAYNIDQRDVCWRTGGCGP